MSSTSAKPVYADMERAAAEIKSLTERTQQLQTLKYEKDNKIIELNTETAKAKDIGTFKFIAQTINKPLDTIVAVFICILIVVFDPLAVALILAFNIATTGKILKKSNNKSTGIQIQVVPTEQAGESQVSNSTEKPIRHSREK